MSFLEEDDEKPLSGTTEVELVEMKNTFVPLATEDDEEDDNDGDDSMFGFLFSQGKDYFVENIPIEAIKNLPHLYKYFFGSLAYALGLAVFGFFLYENYNQAMTQAFISLEESSGDCHTVSIPITGDYYVDMNGNWIGTNEFVYYKSAFHFSFNSLTVDSFSQYTEMINTYRQSMEEVANISSHQNLGLNLVLWMSYMRYYSIDHPSMTDFTSLGTGQLQYLELTGNPAVVFNAPSITASLISKHGICDIESLASFDPANSMFSVTFNIDEFKNSATCAGSINPNLFNPYTTKQSSLIMNLDVRSLSTALSINLGYIPISYLGTASANQFQVELNGIKYNFAKYFDTRYPTMAPILCMSNASAIPEGTHAIDQLCFVMYGTSLFFPFMNHIGNSFQVPTYCDCAAGTGTSTACQKLYLMASMLFFYVQPGPTDTMISLIIQQVKLLSQLHLNQISYYSLNRKVYNSTASSSLYMMGTGSDSLNSTQWVQETLSFCTVGTSTCSIISFATISAFSSAVSTYQFQLTNGSCAASFMLSDDIWEEMSEESPVQLTENYFECYQSMYSAALNAVGVASGNSSIAMLFLLIITMPILYITLAIIRQIPPPPEYSDRQTRFALETLATLLLRLRDGKTDGLRENGVLAAILRELIEGLQPKIPDKRQRSQDPEDPYQDDDDDDDRMKNATKHFGRRRLPGMSKVPSSRIFDSPYSNRIKSPASQLGISPKRLPDANVSLGIRILNVFDPRDFYQYQTIEDEFAKATPDEIIYTMVKCFSSALLANHKPRKTPMLSSASPAPRKISFIDERKQPQENEVIEGKEGIQSVSFYQTMDELSADDHAEQDFIKGCLLSRKLINMNIDHLINREDSFILVKLVNALSMHASLDMQLDMKEIEKYHCDHIGYNIGGKLLTFSALSAFSTNSSF